MGFGTTHEKNTKSRRALSLSSLPSFKILLSLARFPAMQFFIQIFSFPRARVTVSFFPIFRKRTTVTFIQVYKYKKRVSLSLSLFVMLEKTAFGVYRNSENPLARSQRALGSSYKRLQWLRENVVEKFSFRSEFGYRFWNHNLFLYECIIGTYCFERNHLPTALWMCAKQETSSYTV